MIHVPSKRDTRLSGPSPLRTALLAVLAGTFAGGCSTEEWEAPPASTTAATGNSVELVQDLTDVMEQRGLWVLEYEDEPKGLRVSLDRRPGTPGGVFLAPGNMQPQPVTPPSGTTEPVAKGPDLPPSSGSRITDTRTGGQPATGAGSMESAPQTAAFDEFHPDNRKNADGSTPPAPAPVYGGRVIVHLASLPKHMNYVTENSAVTRRMLYEAHETLLHQDWEYHDLRPRIARDFDTEDMVVLQPGAETRYAAAKPLRVRPAGHERPFDGFVVFGRVEELAGGYRVSPLSQGGSALAQPLAVDKDDVMAVEKGCVMTFRLRDDVRWQPATGTANGRAYNITDETLDAEDVRFSWSIYSNSEVDCDEKRFQFEKFTDCEVLGSHEIRFFCQEQYAFSQESIGVSMTILPAHVYDLADPKNPWHDPAATASAQATHINENPHNQLWVGVGPYQITEWNQQYVEAQRFDDYFDPENGGYVDTIRWRYIGDDNTAFSAVLNRELDFFERVKTQDYFGAGTERSEFTEHFYKGYKYLGQYGYTGWNSHRPYLSDKRVRQALAHAFPFDEFLRTTYRNLARQVTGPFPYQSPAYDHSIQPFPLNYDRARELLEEAGYFDSDGNGIVDKDGRDLVIEFMMPSGNDASKTLGLTMQESFGRIGVKLEFAALEWATFLDRMKKREFDGCNLAWVPSLESDPEQLWHSRWGAPGIEGSNNSGMREPEIDAMILEGTRELDHAKRQAVWRRMHAYIYDWQPYLFGYNVPQKFAMSRRIRGFQAFAIDPGYSIRRWHFTSDEPGTRATRN